MIGQNRQQRICRVVIADYTEESRRYTKTCKVYRNICGATRTLVRFMHVDNRHRRFRRNPSCGSEKVTIEHDVAGDDDVRFRKIRY